MISFSVKEISLKFEKSNKSSLINKSNNDNIEFRGLINKSKNKYAVKENTSIMKENISNHDDSVSNNSKIDIDKVKEKIEKFTQYVISNEFDIKEVSENLSYMSLILSLLNNSLDSNEFKIDINKLSELNLIDNNFSCTEKGTWLDKHFNTLDINDFKNIINNTIIDLKGINLKNDLILEDLNYIKENIDNIFHLLSQQNIHESNNIENITSFDNVVFENNDDVKDMSQEKVTYIFAEDSELSEDLNNNSFTNNSKKSEEDDILSKFIGQDSFASKVEATVERLNVKSLDGMTEPKVVTKWSMKEDIITNIKFMTRNTLNELRVKIYPKELGEMTIKLLSEEGIMKAEIKSISKDTYNLLNANIQDIKKSLESQGIKIQSVEIGLYNDDTTFYSSQNNSNFFKESNENRDKETYFIDSDDIEEETDAINNDVNLSYLA